MKEFRLSLPNHPGELARVAEALGRRGVNILSVAAIGAASPVVALVAEQEDQARTELQGLGVSFQEAELLTVKLADRPGQLGELSKKLGDAQVNIDSVYLLGKAGGDAELALSVSELDKAKQALAQ